MKQVRPSFFIIGAQKAGTTTLHHWLASQPHVGLPTRKETHFFSHNERFALGSDWYQRQFPKGKAETIYGEIDPDYLFFKDACERIHQLGGSPKFVVIVREPLIRAYSHYRMSVRRGLENLNFGQALKAEKQRLSTDEPFHLNHHSYLARGQYSKQIGRYIQKFGASAILILTFDDLFDPQKSLSEFARICDFLGISAAHPPEMIDRKFNPASTARFSFITDLLWRKEKWRPVRNLIRRLTPWPDLKYKISRFIDNANQKKITQSDHDITAVDRHFIHLSNQETEYLASATGLNLTHWIRTVQ